MTAPLVLELKGNSLDDGPGIRTAVFLKGCPLSCIWCHNPESKRTEAELSVSADDCIGCMGCAGVCPQHAASPNIPGIVNRKKCVCCFTCTEHCPAKSLQRVGKEMSISEIVAACLKDKPFYDVSGGGVTLTGGEATMFPEWVGALAAELTRNGIRVHLETCGYFSYERIREHLLPFISSIYMDMKIMDEEAHRKYCGVSNQRILENFLRLREDANVFGYSLLPRTPLIPGITDTDENLAAIAAFYKEHSVSETELLPYNPTWYKKTEKLGGTMAEELKGLDHWQSAEKIEHCKEIFTKMDISCK